MTLASLETDRLHLRALTLEDAGFMCRLLNEPSFLTFIGDRGVRTVAEARAYMAKGPLDQYARHGLGMYAVVPKGSVGPVGVCGLVNREGLDGVDLGFAFLPEFCGKGYAFESSVAVLEFASRALGLERLLAIVSPKNERSIALLLKLGFRYDRPIRMTADAEELRLYVRGPGRGN